VVLPTPPCSAEVAPQSNISRQVEPVNINLTKAQPSPNSEISSIFSQSYFKLKRLVKF